MAITVFDDLLGIHPHHVHTHDISGGPTGQPAHALIELTPGSTCTPPT